MENRIQDVAVFCRKRIRWGRLQQAQRGQTLLILVLVLVVALTVGLSAVSRSIVNLQVSTDEENTKRAFSAAEAGIERALKAASVGDNIIADQQLDALSAIKEVDITTLSGTSVLMNDGNPVLKDDGVDVWLSSYPDYSAPQWDGSLQIFWGKGASACADAALSIVSLTGSKDNPTVTHYAVDPCDLRRASNNFSAAGAGGDVSGKTFDYSTTIVIPGGSGLLLRVTPLYTSTVMGVKTASALPPQGTIIESIGSSGTTQRKLTVINTYPKVPNEFFPFMIFSPQ